MDCFDVFFLTVSFFSSQDYSILASGETMENNPSPGSESTGLACINIDGHLACFLCLQCFREFYCSPVSLLRQYLWVGRPVYSVNKEQQWWLCSSARRGVPHLDSLVCVFTLEGPLLKPTQTGNGVNVSSKSFAISFLSVFDTEMKEHFLLGITQTVIEAIAFNPTVTALSCY